MKIVCHACQASFQTSDDKIRGRVVKYHCRKCNAVLTVDGTVLSSASTPPPAPVEEAPGPMSLDAPLDLSGLTASPSEQVATTRVAPRTPASSKEMNWDEEPTVHREPPPPAASPAPFAFPIFGGAAGGAAKRAPRPNPDRNKTQPGLGVSFEPVLAPKPTAALPVRPPREASIELSAELIPPSGDVVDERLIEDAPPSSGLPPAAVPTVKTPEPTVKTAEDEEPPVSLVPDSEGPPSSGLPLSVLGGLPKPAAEASSRVNLDDLLSLGDDPAAPPALSSAAMDWDLGASAGPLWQTPEPEPVAPVAPDVPPPPPPRREERSEPDAVLSSLPPGPPPFEVPRVGSIAPATAVTEAPGTPPKRSPVLFFVGGIAATVAVFFAFRSTLLPAAPVARTTIPVTTAEPVLTAEPTPMIVDLSPTEPTAPVLASAIPEPAPSATTAPEPTNKTEPVAKAEPTSTAKTESTAKAEPTSTAKAEPTSTTKAEPTSTAKTEPTSTAKTEPTSTAKTEPTSTAKAETPTAPTAPVVPTVALPASGSDEFNKDAARGALASAAGAAAGCAKEDGPKGVAKVQVTFSTSGRVTQAQIAGPPFAGTSVGGCIAAAFRRASVPPFSGAPVTVTKTVSIQ